MSTQQPSAAATIRARVPRLAEAAVERARLSVVPPRPLGRTQAARTPFAVLVIALLAAGVVGLLMFNTHMQQTSFTATALQQQATSLTSQKQSLVLELDQLRDPQRVAEAARDLGMVASAQPAFIRLEDGRVLGKPAPASGNDAVQITPGPVQKPAQLERKTVVVAVDPETGRPLPRGASAANGD